MSPPVRGLLASLCSFSCALASRTEFRRGLGLEMAGRVWRGTEGPALSGSVNDLDETSCELPADGGMLTDLVRRCKSDSSNFG